MKSTFRILRRGTLACAALQLAWLALDPTGPTLLPNLVGLASHATTWWILHHLYPAHMGLEQPATYAAVGLLIAHQTAWMWSWVGTGGGLMHIAAVLASLVWPVPTLLILSAADGEGQLPLAMSPRAAALDSALSAGSSIPGSPAAAHSGQPGSPFYDARRQVARSLHHRQAAAAAAHPLLPTDTAREGDQLSGARGLLQSLHVRKGSAGSSCDGGGSSSSRGLANGWGFAEALLQQGGQQQKARRSRVVRVLDGVARVLGKHTASILPVTQQPPVVSQQRRDA